MFDYSLPIARRTRQRVDQVYREYYEQLKKRNEKNYGVDSSTASIPNASLCGEFLKNVGFGQSYHDSKKESFEEIRVYRRRRKRDYPVEFLSIESSPVKNLQKSEIGGNRNEKEDISEVNSSSDEAVMVDYEKGVDSANSKCSVSGNFSILNSVNTAKCDDNSINVDHEVVSGNFSILNSINVDVDCEEIEPSSSDMDSEVDEPEISQSFDSSESSLSSYAESGRKKTVKFEKKRMDWENLSKPFYVGEDGEIYSSLSDDNVGDNTDFSAEIDDSGKKTYTSEKRSDFYNETCQGHLKACSDKWEWKTNNAKQKGKQEKGMRNSMEGFTLAKRKAGNKNLDVYNILVDTIFKNEDMHVEERVGPEIGSLPQTFKFGVDESTVPEKSDEELELDKLWAELDFCLRSSEMDSVESDLAKTVEVSPSHNKVDKSTSCVVQCAHQLILDEEIGVKCRLCSYVKLEIKYFVPSFGEYPFGKPRRRYYGHGDSFTINDLHNDDINGDFNIKSNSQNYSNGTVWDIIPGIKNSMYPHQREGFEFLWKNIAGGIDLDKLRDRKGSHEGSGCIISHAPGTGKTRLTIVFLQAYMELNPTCRPVIVAPRSMLLTWEEEFQKWKVGIPFHNLNKTELSGKENMTALKIMNRTSQNTMITRMVKLYSWKNETSILGISYRLFEKLAGSRVNSKWDKARTILLEFPGIVFFDEGHIPRNDGSLIWKTLTKLKTEKRIILSGTPFQNNFTELYNTLRLVRPMFANTKDEILEKKRGRKKKVCRGKWDSLTSYIGKDADDKLEQTKLKEIRAMIEPFVHIHRGSILQERLPGLRNLVIVLQPGELQRSILHSIQEVKNPVELDYFEALISVHPSLFLKLNRKECPVDMAVLETNRLNVDPGVKTKFILELVRLSQTLNEKVLIFSQYLEPLSLIKEHLEYNLDWSEGKEVLCMDGSRDIKNRQFSINIFNDPASEARVLLASTKACCEGINLVGASRVVLLDVVWNPSVERQAICRAYRLGQEKLVYTYHLIASGTGEEEKYGRKMEKDRISEMVFSSSAKISGMPRVSASVLDDRILEAMVEHDKIKHIFEKIMCISKDFKLTNYG